MLKIILDSVSNSDDQTKSIEVEVCKNILNWTVAEKKQFLINILRLRFANVLYEREEFRKSRKENDLVLEKAKEVDDKKLLVESHLLESKLIYESKNLPKAKASLIACRAAANMVYIN